MRLHQPGDARTQSHAAVNNVRRAFLIDQQRLYAVAAEFFPALQKA